MHRPWAYNTYSTVCSSASAEVGNYAPAVRVLPSPQMLKGHCAGKREGSKTWLVSLSQTNLVQSSDPHSHVGGLITVCAAL